MEYFCYQLQSFVWSPPLLILLAGTGLFLTWRLRGIQFRYFWVAVRSLVFSSSDSADKAEGEVTPFQALMTAMASAIGTGSIAGISTALCIGGCGALFWLWVTGILGMATSYAEAVLALAYRQRDDQGRVSGGPMHALRHGLSSRVLAALFALFGALAGFGIGSTVQANSVASALESVYGVDPSLSGILLVILTALVLFGGASAVGRISAYIVPVMALTYFLFGLGILCMHYDAVLPALGQIMQSAFSSEAAVGGFTGAGVIGAIQCGVARGVFSSESGMGSTAIAAGSAKVDMPARQGLIAMLGTFVATLCVCTMTGLVLMVTDVVGLVDEAGVYLSGSPLVIKAFEKCYSFGPHIVTFGLLFFAYSTTMAWSFYGGRCVHYLGGRRWVRVYSVVYVALLYVGAVMNLNAVWAFADAMNGLMAIPNLIGVLWLSRTVVGETENLLAKMKSSSKREPQAV